MKAPTPAPIADQQLFRMYNSNGEITKDVFAVDPNGTDRKGNYLLQQVNSTRKVRSHPSRMLPLNTGGAMVERAGDNTLQAGCPECGTIVPVYNGEHDSPEYGNCPGHGQFRLDWQDVTAGPVPVPETEIAGATPRTTATKKANKQRAEKQPKESTVVDFAAIHAIKAELWTKTGIEFDCPNFDVRAHVILIDDDKPRKHSFNSYNGTFGKKPRQNEIAAFLADTPHNGKNVGFYVRGGVDNERKKLIRKGYQREDNGDG